MHRTFPCGVAFPWRLLCVSYCEPLYLVYPKAFSLNLLQRSHLHVHVLLVQILHGIYFGLAVAGGQQKSLWLVKAVSLHSQDSYFLFTVAYGPHCGSVFVCTAGAVCPVTLLIIFRDLHLCAMYSTACLQQIWKWWNVASNNKFPFFVQTFSAEVKTWVWMQWTKLGWILCAVCFESSMKPEEVEQLLLIS